MRANLDLLLTLTGGLAAALVLGFLTHRIGLSPIVGYLLAGVAVGPNTPGFVANRELADQMAEIGVILLMFGVGLHFHIDELLAVRRIAVPGAIVQSLVATALGTVVAWGLGWAAGVARSAYLRERRGLRKAGADEVIAGVGEVALAMAESVLRVLALPPSKSIASANECERNSSARARRPGSLPAIRRTQPRTVECARFEGCQKKARAFQGGQKIF